MRRFALIIVAAALVTPLISGTAYAQGTYGRVQGDSRAQIYSKLVNTYLSADITDKPLRDVVDFLANMGDIDILADWDEDGFGPGLDPEKMVTLQLKNRVSLVSILEQVLDQAVDEEATWVLGEGFIKIGTKEDLNKHRYVRIYPVRELLFVVPTFYDAPELDLQSILSGSQNGEINQNIFDDEQQDNQDGPRSDEEALSEDLIEMITSIVDPLQWEDGGGEGGSIRYFKGSLIVNAADYLHRQVGGYPFTVRRVRDIANTPNERQSSLVRAPRYVSLTGRWGLVKIVDIEQSAIPVLVGGQVFSSGGGGGG